MTAISSALRDGDAIQHRLQHRAPSDHRLPRRPISSRLVIGHAQRLVRPARRSIRSTEPRSKNRPSRCTGSGTLRGSRPSSLKPKLNSKYSGIQSCADGSRRAQTRRSRAISAISSRHTRSIAGASCSWYSAAVFATSRSRAASTRGRLSSVTGRQLFGLKRPKELGLDLVEQRAARQRIELLQRLGILRRLETVDRRQQELIRTGGELLQRRQRIRTRRQPLARRASASSCRSPA